MNKDIIVRRETPGANGGFTATRWHFRFFDDRYGQGPKLSLSEVIRETRPSKRHKVREARAYTYMIRGRDQGIKDLAKATPEDVLAEAKTSFLAYLAEHLIVEV